MLVRYRAPFELNHWELRNFLRLFGLSVCKSLFKILIEYT